MNTDLAFRYANPETFLKMLESQELWFTDLRNMNDWDEYSAGYRITKDVIINEYPNHIQVLEKISRDQMHDDFMMLICSLTSDGDCLSMWRGYGDNGRGAAIGYSTFEIENHHLYNRYLQKLSPIQGKAKFYPVIYSEEEFKTQIRSYEHRLFTLRDNTPQHMINDILTYKSHIFVNLLTKLCTLYKNDFLKTKEKLEDLLK